MFQRHNRVVFILLTVDLFIRFMFWCVLLFCSMLRFLHSLRNFEHHFIWNWLRRKIFQIHLSKNSVKVVVNEFWLILKLFYSAHMFHKSSSLLLSFLFFFLFCKLVILAYISVTLDWVHLLFDWFFFKWVLKCIIYFLDHGIDSLILNLFKADTWFDLLSLQKNFLHNSLVVCICFIKWCKSKLLFDRCLLDFIPLFISLAIFLKGCSFEVIILFVLNNGSISVDILRSCGCSSINLRVFKYILWDFNSGVLYDFIIN